MKLKLNTASRIRLALAFAAMASAMVGSASAAISTTELTTAITSGVTAAEGLIGAGLALTALFIIAKVIKKGAAKIG